MRSLAVFILCLLSLSAEAKRDSLPAISMGLVGPKKISVTPSEAQKIRLLPNAQYEMAKNFSGHFGHAFLDLLLSRLSSDDITNVVVNKSTAEHLGTLLEIGLAKRGLLSRVQIHYVDLSAEQIRTWRIVRIGQNHRLRVGLGPIPAGWEQEYAIPFGSVEELADQLRDLNLTERERRIIVVDSGFEGAAAEAIAAVMRYWRPDELVDVEGIQLAHTTDYDFQHTLLIHVLAAQPNLNGPDVERWAWMFSQNRVLKQERFAGEYIFQKSSGIGSRPDQALTNYRATLLGFYDGLAKSCSEELVSN
jgi:hypothetical protein